MRQISATSVNGDRVQLPKVFNGDILLYLGSRIISAAGAFAAVAIFTRIAGAVEYGHYLLIFAWAMIVFAFSTQWIIAAYFGVYDSKRLREFVASLYRLLVPALALAGAGLIGAEFFGFKGGRFVVAVFAMVVGMTLYYSAFDAARTAAKPQAASLSMVLRALLIVALGSLALCKAEGATGLAVAVMAAHLIAAIPCWIAIGGVSHAKKTSSASRQILTYGWPLMLSFGAMALGQNIDRLILEYFLGISALGPYGAVSELMRQCFAVFGEVILFSMITTAKQHSVDGNVEASTSTLRTAFNACLATSVFGAAFFIVFGERVVHLVLPAAFHAAIGELIPIFAIAYAFMMLSQYYFAHVIYFTRASHLAVISSATIIAVSGILSFLLIPIYGAKGGAIALLAAYALSCGALIVVSRRYYRMPVDLRGLAGISLLAVLFVATSQLLACFEAAGPLLISQSMIFVSIGTYVVSRYGLLSTISGQQAVQAE